MQVLIPTATANDRFGNPLRRVPIDIYDECWYNNGDCWIRAAEEQLPRLLEASALRKVPRAGRMTIGKISILRVHDR